MPRLLEKDDVMQTAVNLGRAKKVWSEQLVTGSGDMTFKLPEGGMYQVVFVRVENVPNNQVEQAAEKKSQKKPCIADFIGYGRRFNPEYRSTAEIMKELREGEEE